MEREQPLWRVLVSFTGATPARQVARASGVSDVEVNGSELRCLVCGSFQPFLEALRGHEVVGLSSVELEDNQASASQASASQASASQGGSDGLSDRAGLNQQASRG